MDNYIEYIATGKCNQFQNIFYTAAEADIEVKKNGTVVPTSEYHFVYGVKYVEFTINPADGDRIRITNLNLVSNPDPDLEVLRNDVSQNTQTIQTLESNDLSQQNSIAANTANIANNANDISDLEVDLGHTNNNVTVNTNSIASLDTRVHTNEQDILTNAHDIANLSDQESNVQDLQTRMTAAEAEIINVSNYAVANRHLIEEDRATLSLIEAKYDHLAQGERELLNNQTAPVDIYEGVGDTMLVDADTEFSASLEVEIMRENASDSYNALIQYHIWYAGTWHIERTRTIGLGDSEPDGIELSIVMNGNQGKFAYTSSNVDATDYEGTLRFKLYKMRNTL